MNNFETNQDVIHYRLMLIYYKTQEGNIKYSLGFPLKNKRLLKVEQNEKKTNFFPENKSNKMINNIITSSHY